MKLFLALVLSLQASATPASGFTRVLGPLPPESDASEHYAGQVVLSGRYVEDEAGELCFQPDSSSARRTKVVPAESRLCFSNEEQAATLLGATQAAAALDSEKVCGMVGAATIVVSGLWVGDGPATRWYTTCLVKVVKRAPPYFLACGA